MNTQASRGERFRMLHARPGIFAIPNPWDAGSAKILALLGFEALATTSAGFAFSVGKPDAEGALNRADTLANARAIVDATTLPVSADLENGFGDDPDTCAETICAVRPSPAPGNSSVSIPTELASSSTSTPQNPRPEPFSGRSRRTNR